VLRSIEMDVFDNGEGDMDPAVLAELDLVLGAFHSKLRSTDDATERYLAALRNPDLHVLAHPTTRMFGRRAGLVADWPRVFAEAARLGKAVELDATPRRQDLPVDLARIAVAEGVQWFSMGSDAHYIEELDNLPFAMATAILAGVPRDRIIAYRSADDVVTWAAGLRENVR
jgi:DNA polymerase (family 10)